MLVQDIVSKIIKKSNLGFYDRRIPKNEDNNQETVRILSHELQADDLLAMETTSKGMRTMIDLIHDATKIARISLSITSSSLCSMPLKTVVVLHT